MKEKIQELNVRKMHNRYYIKKRAGAYFTESGIYLMQQRLSFFFAEQPERLLLNIAAHH